MLASLTGMKELILDKAEADQLSDKIAALTKLYDAPGISPRTKAWINLIFVAGGIYGTRIMTYNLRKAGERAAHPPAPRAVKIATAAPPNNVTPMRPTSRPENPVPPLQTMNNVAQAPVQPRPADQTGFAADSVETDPMIEMPTAGG